MHFVIVKISGISTLTIKPFIHIYIYLFIFLFSSLSFLRLSSSPMYWAYNRWLPDQTVLGHQMRKHPSGLRTRVNKATKLKVIICFFWPLLGVNNHASCGIVIQLYKWCFIHLFFFFLFIFSLWHFRSLFSSQKLCKCEVHTI